ncbi:MAG: transcriptional regulator [Verrucomicrobiaceae bacterium]|nr:MAG: transcriptional regulator [Verrucomicrobiaceae bacterium]
MITETELLKLMGDLESDRVERTVSTTNTDKFAQAICAFANDFPAHRQPGYLLIGVRDNGELSGLKVTDDLLLSLGALRSDGNIQPMPALAISRFALADGEVAVVEVLPAHLPPVRYKGRVYLRVGPRRATASEQEERILTERRIAHSLTFDALPCLESTLADLSEDRFRLTYLRHAVAEEVIAENGRPLKQQLASLRFFDLRQDCPTHAGILVLADRPMHYLLGAYVQFVRYAAPDLASEVLDEKRALGDLRTLLQTLNLIVDANLRQRPVAVDGGFVETMIHDYPRIALRELLLNAVIHRNYQSTAPIRFYFFPDHLTIDNPGGLYGDVTAESFPRTTGYRNPIIAEASRVLGYTNRFGQGIARATKALELNGNPPAEYRFDAHHFTVTLRRGREKFD